jgi:hypothetical protein
MISAPEARSFFACCDCGILHPVVECAAYAAAEDDATQELSNFIAQHGAHRITHVERQDAEAVSDRPLWDPMATVIFPVTDGTQVYIVRGGRRSIDEPREYRFSVGVWDLHASEVTVDDSDLRRGLDRAVYPHAVRPSSIDRFIGALHDAIRHLRPEDLEIAFDAADEPNVSVARLPEATYAELVTRGAEIFDAAEWPSVRGFLDENRGEDGLLALRVRWQAAVRSAC